ncbi:MAG: glycosyltransferase family 2 protein [Myxococcota bacterium]
MAAPEMSLIVPIYGPSTRLENLLEGLRQQTVAPDRFEVVVVDDGSPEPIRIDTDPLPYACSVHRQENAGPAAARNRALTHARADLVLILNDDALPDPRLLEIHLAKHRTAAPKTAVMGSFPFAPRALRGPFTQLLSTSDLLFDFQRLSPGRLHDWHYFWTCNLSLSRQAILDVGGFDEQFAEPVMEDTELGYRLDKQGWSVLYVPEAICEHDHRLSPERYFHRMERYGANLLRMYHKHRDPLLFGISDDNRVEPSLQRLQLIFENLYPTYRNSLASFARLEAECEGQSLPEATRQSAIRVVGDMRHVSMVRGINVERGGLDPAEVVETGPPRGEETHVVVVSYNAEAKTRDCLEALRKTEDPDFPITITVVDNGSSDGSLRFLRSQRDIRLIENTENRGAPRARNQALESAAPSDVVFLDNDVIVYPGWLERLRYHAAIDPLVGCVVPCADRAAHGQQVETQAASTPEALRAFAARHAEQHHRKGEYQILFTSLCVFVRAEVLTAIGGFDERFSPWGFEDDDFSLRARLAGYRTRLANDVFVHHAHYEDAAKADRHRGHLQANWRRFALKWGGPKRAPYGRYDFLDRLLQGDVPMSPLRVPLERHSDSFLGDHQ